MKVFIFKDIRTIKVYNEENVQYQGTSEIGFGTPLRRNSITALEKCIVENP